MSFSYTIGKDAFREQRAKIGGNKNINLVTCRVKYTSNFGLMLTGQESVCWRSMGNISNEFRKLVFQTCYVCVFGIFCHIMLEGMMNQYGMSKGFHDQIMKTAQSDNWELRYRALKLIWTPFLALALGPLGQYQQNFCCML